ncbi:MAG: excinuclease ABC subunit A, partial [Planctomycetes bacterium SCN 63-9]
LPRDRLVVLTGVSGSGKSSLAFDTIFAEGQRRYLECVASHARQLVNQLERPDLDEMDGLPPTVAIDQKTGTANPRSTVGTITEVHDFLRLLFARLGVPHCPVCGQPIRRQTPEQMANSVMALEAGRKVIVLAPLVRGRKGEHADAFQAIRRAGLIRARVDGEMVEVAEKPPKLAKTKAHTIEAVIDRLVIREGIRPRVAESLALALKLADGLVTLSVEIPGQGWVDQTLSIHFACPTCNTSLPILEPRSFSFNSPYGACPGCQGLGVVAESASEKSQADQAVEAKICPSCNGTRLRSEARAVRFEGKSIDELSALSIRDLREFFQGVVLDPAREPVGTPLVREIENRLGFLEEVGLSYLSLSRSSDSLSGGELQRARLATQLGAGLVGVCYVLDEPTAGLHPSDTDRLIGSIRRLQQQGNSLIVVEHDEAVIRAADWVVDLGPGAGPDGGLLMAEGPFAQFVNDPNSVTARYLRESGAAPRDRRDCRAQGRQWIEIRDAAVHNLKSVNVNIPRNALTCITGLSGSGKSTLIHDVLVPGFRAAKERGDVSTAKEGENRVLGVEGIETLINVDQSPIGRTPRSTPATFTTMFQGIRRVFAATREAKIRGYSSTRFSFNAKGGRCEHCEGLGVRRLPMSFLPDLYVTCDVCLGKRFNRQTLEVLFKGKSIGDVLELRVDEAIDFFGAHRKILSVLTALHEVGLGYVTLGQSSTTLSGGEAQRVKLAAELARPTEDHALYILDEPTTGLHFEDVDRLNRILQRLVDQGNTVIVIEHNPDVILAADWVVDLGPGAGDAGGRVVAQGTPLDVARIEESRTGAYLKMRLEGR